MARLRGPVLWFLPYRGSRASLRGFRKVALPIVEFQALFLELRINDLDLDATIRAISRFIGRRVGHQVLLSQVALDLGKRLPQLPIIVGKVSAAAGLLRNLAQCAFDDTFIVLVTNSDCVDKRIRFLCFLDGFMNLDPAACVIAICKQDDCAPRVLRGFSEQFV